MCIVCLLNRCSSFDRYIATGDLADIYSHCISPAIITSFWKEQNVTRLKYVILAVVQVNTISLNTEMDECDGYTSLLICTYTHSVLTCI